ncbi:MAG: nucleoside monophosphate kinase [Anaerolineae bacterium]|nr:nucleoside monophosphate kinase [Anaerolineae bacterium]NUQ03599.1 nucleoside monophosphate kinase [Anaerolineae bacterium]
MGLYIILMGVQGAGKGEQAKFISQSFDIPHVSTGDLFRAMKTRTDALAQRIQGILAAGKLVDDDTTNQVVSERLSQPDAEHGVILDGYPRTPAQAEWLDRYLQSRGERIGVVLLLQLDLYTAFKRAFGRVTDSETGKSYNIYYNSSGIDWKFVDHPTDKQFPPRLLATLSQDGRELTRRSDDGSAHAVLTRIDTYTEQTRPLIAYYDEKGVVVRIDADQTIEQVGSDIRRAIQAAQGK